LTAFWSGLLLGLMPRRFACWTFVESAALLMAVATALLAAGCGTAEGPRGGDLRSDAAGAGATGGRIDEGVHGRVVLVNPVLRYVVMEFPAFKLPAIGQKLMLYRQGQKVGEVKATGPSRDSTMAGDLTAGGAQVGDEVREE
jgi:hypothetical protein